MATHREAFKIFVSTFALFVLNVFGEKENTVQIDYYFPIAEISDKFVGVTIDTGIVRERWKNFDFNSTKLLNLAAALSPSYIRMGGTDADFCVFSNNDTVQHVRNKRDVSFSKKKHWSNFTLSSKDWDNIHTFIQKVGWDLVFDLNSLQRKGREWDPTNAMALIEYTKKKGYKVAGWELGNEPGEYVTMGLGYNVTANQLANDFLNLSALLKKQPSSLRGNILIGPSTIPLVQHRVVTYFGEFFHSGGGKAVTSPNFHHYYLNGRLATFNNFVDPHVLNSLKLELEIGNKVTEKYAPGKKVWMGETSSCWGGGAENISDTYVAAFMWIDKLGLAARHNYGAVIRQTFVQGNYALLDPKSWDPNPDYWLTLLYKKLVGNKVFPVFLDDFTEKIRLYAHCANTLWYKPGALTLYGMNLYDSNKTIHLSQFGHQTLDLYLMEPPDGDMKSKNVMLNSKVLTLSADYKVPDLHTPVQIKRELTIPQYTYFFLVIPHAMSRECMTEKL